ncbi:MAG: hypothetical protein OXM57_02635 [bacterium]|nr:hypothetical protein [bacterium]
MAGAPAVQDGPAEFRSPEPPDRSSARPGPEPRAEPGPPARRRRVAAEGSRSAAAGSTPAFSEVPETHLLPAAPSSEGSPLASLLGFGEVETSFDNRQTERTESFEQTTPDDEYWNQLPSLSSVTAEMNGPRNVGDAVKAMWDATSEWDMDSKLLSDDLPGMGTKDRRGLWRMVAIGAGLAIMVTLIGASYKTLTDMPVQAAAAREAQYTQSAQELFDTLGPVANSVYADGLSSDAGLSSLTSHLSDLDIAARRSASLAAEPLPSTPILGMTADINALAGPRDLLASGSAQALSIGQQIGDAMAYSLTMSLAFNLPELPEQAPPGQVDEIALQLSTSIAETSLLLARLPDDPVFEGFRQKATETVASVEQIQAEYISALRSGDATRAADVRNRLGGAISGLREELHVPMGEIKTWAVSRLDQVAAIVTQL